MGAFDDLIPGAAAPAGAFDDLVPRKAQADGGGSDLLKSLKVGAQKLPGQLTGLLDIPAALTSGDRPISRAADWVGEKTGFQPGKWARDTKFSPGYDASRAAVDETWKPVEAVAADPNTSKADVVRAFADNLPQILKGYGANPMYSVNQVAESVPGMVAGGVLSRGLMTAGRAAGAGTGALEGVAGKWAAPIAGGVGEGAQQAGQVMDEFQGQDQRKAAIAALASGGLDALIAAGGGRVANRLGLETPETAMAKLGDRVGSKSAGAALGAGAKVAGGAVSEGVFQELPQSMQEQAWQNWAEGKPLGEGVLRGGIEGGIAGGMMGAGANVSLPRAGKAAASPAAGAAEPVPAADVVGSAEPSDAEKALTAAPTPLRPERIASTEGAPTTFSTEAGSRLEGRYALVEAGEVQASHDTDLRPNPAFPPELQPRDRTRAASEAQIQNIVGRIDPARLGLSADAGTGAPIIGEDGLVESGNARTIALQRVYGANGQKAHEYRTWLRDNAASFGLTPDQVEGMRQPMLVRVRTTPVDRAEFARQANASTVAAMSPLEQARADAARIDTMDDLRPDEQGGFGTSRDFIRRFVGRLPQTEQAGMIDAGGRLSASGYARVRNAVLAKAYGDSPVLARMVESMDDNLRNVSRALMMAAPRVAQVRSQVEAGRLHAADLTPDLVAAVTELERIKQRGGSVADALAQRGLDGEKHTPVQRELLQFLDENIRRPRRIAEFIGAYADALEAAGHPGQGSLLADAAPPTVPDLLAAAKRETASQAETAPAAAAPATASQPNPAAAAANEPEVDGNWRAFGPETGTLGVPRSEMPQVKMKARPALFDFLQTRGIGHIVTTLDADTLKPTQAEYSEDKTNRAAEITSPEDPRNQVLVSSDGYIIDGHHRWLASARAHGKVNAVQFDAPAGRVLDAMMQFPGTTVSRESAGAVTPSVRDLAVQDLKAAVGELGEFLTRHMRAAFTEEDERRVMPILVKLFDAGIRVVGTDLRKVMAWMRDHLRRNKDVLPGWNKIPATVHRKAAEKALAGLEQRGQQLGLFSETEQAQPDLFSAPPEPSNQVGKPEVATIDGRPYDPARDNYRLPATDSFIPAATLAKARGTVARLAKESTPVEIDAGDSARAEAMLRPLIEKAKADKPAYDQKIIDIAKKIGALGQMLAPVKGIRRAVVKLVTDEKFNVDGMKDMLRSTIVVGSYADAQAAVDAIRDEFGAIIMPGRVKNRTDATITAPESDGKGGFQPSGYGDVLVNVRLPSGVVAEIQINVPEMLSAKSEEGHALYEIERSERPGSQAHAAAVAAQAEIYTLASAAAASRAARTTDAGLPTASRKSASEISDQRSGHRAAGDMPAEGSRSSTTNRLPSGNSTYTSSTPSPSFKSMPNRQPSGNLSGTLFASTPEIVPAQASAGESAQPDAGRYNAGDVNPRANPAQGAAGPDAEGSGGPGRRPGRAGGGADAGAADAGGLGQPRPDGVRGADADGAAPGARSAHHADGGSPAAGRLIGPKTGRNYRFTADDIPSGSWFRRATRNLEALQLLRRLESEQRKATPDEQRVLAQFSGWGASELANNLFDDKKADVRARKLSALKQAKDGLGDRSEIRPRDPGYWAAYDALGGPNVGSGIRYGDSIPASRITPAAFGLTADAQRWQNLREQLKAAMTPAEWAASARSTQYAHYTSHAVVRSMWGAMQRFGFAGGTIFEPGAGNGIFPGLMPVEMATNSAYTGIEFDPVTGGILKQLQPDEKILVESFVDTRLPREFFDVAIGNPPFSGTKIIADPDYKKHAFALHDYFFAKTLDRVRPGGLLAFVTSRYTMDKAGDKARQFMAERADLIGAIRLPQTAFKANAGTDVVTDVLFLRKKDGHPFDQAQPWLKAVPVETKDGPAVVNEYFAAHPEMVLGTPALAGTMYSKNEYTVLPPAGDIEALFAAAVERLPADVYSTRRGTADEAAKVREVDYNPKAKKEGNYYLSDKGMLMQREGGIGRSVELKSTAQAALIKSFIPLRDALKQAQYDQLSGGDWEASLQALQAAYRKFVKAHGQVNQSVTKLRKVKVAELDDNGMPTGRKIDDEQEQRSYPILAAIADDPDWTLVAALEKVNDETGAIAESSFLKGRVLGVREQPRIETPQDALLASLNEVGKVDIERIAHLAHVSVADVQRELVGAIYLDPVGNRWVTADEYLSGDVKQKLADARAAAAVDQRFEGNVKALEDAQPAPLTPAQINVAIGMNWIPGSDYAKFLRETAGVRATVEWQPATKTWNVTELAGGHTPAATADWGTLDRNATELLAHALTGRAVRITRSIDIGGTKKTIPDPVATEAANEKLKQLQEAFARWLWSDAERTDRLVREYNDRFNTTVPRAFDGRHLTLPGVSTQFHIFDHVKRGAWRIIQSGNTYLAHAVGSGKTFQCVIAAMEMRRLGIASKPMVVVPNHMLQQFAREWQELYPAARLMIADEQNFHTDNRRRFVSRAALSDLDGIVITHSAFKLLDIDPEFKQKIVQRELDILEAALEEAEEEDGKRSVRVKQIQRQIENLQQKLDAAMSAAGKDKNARFDELGVDFLFVDEAHEFRKLDFATARQVKGIQPQGSARALDLYVKTRWLEEKRPGRSLVMMSGTPITNTVAELYTVQKFMDFGTLERRGLDDFDSWAAMFGRERTELEPNAAGVYEPVTRFSDFVNVPELTQMFRNFADVVTADELAALLGDKRPKVEGGARQIVVTPKSAAYENYQRSLASRVEASRKWKPTKEEPANPDPLIRIIGDGRLAAIDMRFVQPGLANDPDSKLNRLADDVIAAFKAGADAEFLDKAGKVEPVRGDTMMVFSDLGFGDGVAASRGFNARAWFEKRLRDAGVPMAQVAFMSDHKKSTDKAKLFKDVNAGRVRILIGSSKNMGTGVNAQQRLKHLFHLDSPWYPADLEQREGRAVRQGNKNKTVRLMAYATKGTYDENMWKMLATKQLFIDKAMSGDTTVREIEDLSSQSQYDLAAAMVAEDPRVIQLAGAKADVEKLNRLYQAHEEQRQTFREKFRNASLTVEMGEQAMPRLEANAAKVQDLSGDNFVAKADGKTFTERAKWGEALIERFKALLAGMADSQKVGEISGFPVWYRALRDEKTYRGGVVLELPDGFGRLLVADDMTSPMSAAMQAAGALTEVARAPQRQREAIASARNTMDAVRPRLDSAFPMLDQLTEKRAEVRRLEAELAAAGKQVWRVERADGTGFDVTAKDADAAIAQAVATNGGTAADWKAAKVEQPPAAQPDAGGTLLSTATGRGGSMDAAELLTIAVRIARALPGLPPVQVLRSPAEAPEALRQFIESRGANGAAEGALHDGQIYLFADNLASAERAEFVLAEHEAAHAGLRGLLGGSVEASMRWLYESNPRLRNQAEALIQQGMSLAEAVEEVIVDIPSAQLVKLKGWRRFAQLVRDALRRAGFVRLAVRLDRWLAAHMTDQQQADLMVADLVREARAYVAGKPRTSMNAEADAAEQVRWLEGQAKRRGYSSVDDMIEKDYEGFDGLAAMWRAQNPMAARLSRAATAPTAGTPTPAQRAEEIIQTSASTPKPLDAAARTLTRITGLSRLTAATYGLGARLIERITPEAVKAGVVSDYGVPEAVLDRRALLQGKMREELRKSGALLEKLATLTRAESRVAYEWMSGDDTRTADELMKDLPEESVQVLRQVRTMIDQLSQEAVRLGQLEPEAFERHRFAYLRRSYFKHAQEFTPAQRAQREHAIKILGDQYRGRGMVAKAAMKQVQNVAPDWWKRKLVDGKADTSLKGEKFERLERRAPIGAGTLPLDGVEQNKRPGRLLEIHYWPAGEPRPAKYADWESAGTWEVRDTKGGDLVLWRDFTKDERTKMGEIDEARYAIGKTLQRMIHDVEVGRYLEWLEQTHAKKPGEMFHGTIVEPSERYTATFPPGTWVQVPDTTVPGTSVKRFGKLAGMYLPGPVWNDLRQTMGGPAKPLGEAYHQAQRLWKTSKTALSPAVHTNNVMANFVMADWHDVTAGHVAKALRLILAARTGDGKGLLGRAGNAAGRVAGANDVDAAREILARYEVSGGSLGGWVTAEISREQLAPIVEALQAEVQGAAAATVGGADVGVYAALQHLLHGRFARSFEAAKGSKPVAAALTEGGNLLDLYQAEDDVFRLAAWLRAKEGGASDADAGKVARKSFLDYSINAPWIAALRATALPFVSFSYRAIPMLAQTVAHKPHKILKLMAIAGALNALGVAIGGGGGDDERKLLPEEKAGGVWGLVPKLVRMPWNDANGSPVYLDIRRWIPVGDVFDIGQGHAALPLPPSLMPGGPMAILGELLLNRSAFTGKPITLETDTGMEKAGKVLDHLWKALMPNILGLPGTYATQGVVDAAKGRTDAFGREQSVPQALASSVGVKLGSYPSDVLQRNLQARAKAQIAEIDDQIRQLKRQRMTNRIDQDEFEDAVRRQQEKKRAVMEDLREKID